MIRRLKRRFVTIAMIALLGIMILVLSTVNILFWRNSMQISDGLLTYLAENDGGFHPTDVPGELHLSPDETLSDLPDREMRVNPEDLWNPEFSMDKETAFRTRCFSVFFDSAGDVVSVRTDRIAAISPEAAVAYAEKVIGMEENRGMVGVYRYYVQERSDGMFVGFLDCNESISHTLMLIAISAGILVLSLLAMWILLWAFSGKAIRPVVESLETQKRFIADAGHELKTPLTIINADVAVLSMTGEDNEWVNSIRNQTKRLEGLVKQLLTLSRMEADTPLPMADFSISDAACDIVEPFTAVLDARNIRFTRDVQPGITCHGNEDGLRRLMSILMDNAAKYTPEGGEIRFTLKKSGHTITIETLNTCQPMEKKHLPRLFERFYRVDPARTQATGGYGIGLSIAREIVTRHHGRIKAVCPSPDTITITATIAG